VTDADLDTLRPLIESGAVRPAVDRVCDLDGVPDALRDLAAGRVAGKIVVSLAESVAPTPTDAPG
jgi:NADPH:quinone reductase-like Zn-dependent oxidoreductase